ncbi:hypothetical protein GC207_15735 [bacterium]|nr:hypothetical protein [bacterium]
MKDVVRESFSIRVFFRFAIVLLAFTFAAKIVSIFGQARILQTADPVTGISFRALMLIAAGMEAVVVVILLKSKLVLFKLALICALANCFILYRLFFWAIGSPHFCPCLGTLTDALGMSPGVVDWFLKGVVAYLWLGSVWGLFRYRHHEDAGFDKAFA